MANLPTNITEVRQPFILELYPEIFFPFTLEEEALFQWFSNIDDNPQTKVSLKSCRGEAGIPLDNLLSNHASDHRTILVVHLAQGEPMDLNPERR